MLSRCLPLPHATSRNVALRCESTMLPTAQDAGNGQHAHSSSRESVRFEPQSPSPCSCPCEHRDDALRHLGTGRGERRQVGLRVVGRGHGPELDVPLSARDEEAVPSAAMESQSVIIRAQHRCRPHSAVLLIRVIIHPRTYLPSSLHARLCTLWSTRATARRAPLPTSHTSSVRSWRYPTVTCRHTPTIRHHRLSSPLTPCPAGGG